jgi:hypothetical protein
VGIELVSAVVEKKDENTTLVPMYLYLFLPGRRVGKIPPVIPEIFADDVTKMF